MLAYKTKDFNAQVGISREQLVPQNNFYRQLEDKLDLSFARDLVRPFHAASTGRPSIDPVVFFKLQLIMFFEGIRSERQLMETVSLNLAHRWYLGYDLDEAVPDHSSLSKIRARYGVEVFQHYFERIVELCIEPGLVWGKELYFDGTKVRANAAIDGMKPRWYWQATQQHLNALFSEEQPQTQAVATEPTTASPMSNATLQFPATTATKSNDSAIQSESRAAGESAANPLWLIEKYDGTRLNDQRTATYDRVTDQKVSPTDPDASPMSHFPGDRAKLGYHNHYVVDGGKSRIILAALVTPASVMDNTPMLDLERWVRFHWRLRPTLAVADSKYGTVSNIVGLERDGMKAFVPTSDFSQRTGMYPPERFQYNADRNAYICPQGKELALHSRRQREQQLVYRMEAIICNQCPVKAECTDSESGRHIFRSFFQDYLDRVKAYKTMQAYEKALRKRMVWVEPLFGEAKQWHWMTRFRLRGLQKVNIEGLIVAAGQNLKRLLRQNRPEKPTNPAAGVVLQFPSALFFSFSPNA
jgi:transposase